MNYPCELIRDLIPLCHDGACSEESRKAVEEHLRTCSACRTYSQSLECADASVFLPEEEMKKAASFRSVRKKLHLRQAAVVVTVLAVLTVCFLSAAAVLKKKTSIISYSDNITVAMTDGNLVARLRGSQAEQVSEKRIEFTDNGKTETFLLFSMSASQWDELTTGSDLFSEYLLSPADKGADEIDAVYYYTGSYTGLETMRTEEMLQVLEDAVLLWNRTD